MKKSTFQKPEATYPHGSLREQPEMKEPVAATGQKYRDNYSSYIKNLRTIPCSANNWKDGQELEEGKDYEVMEAGKFYGSKIKEKSFYGWMLIAVPIVQETEDEEIGYSNLKMEVQIAVDRILRDKGMSNNDTYDAINSAFEQNKSKFTIQRRKQ